MFLCKFAARTALPIRIPCAIDQDPYFRVAWHGWWESEYHGLHPSNEFLFGIWVAAVLEDRHLEGTGKNWSGDQDDPMKQS